MSDALAPLVPEHVDLRSFPYMPLDVMRLRDSDIAAVVSADAFRSAVILWCAAWHQVPAASLPSDDVSLCRLAGYGRDMASWLVVKDEALRGFALCTDGRLYHHVIAEKALTAWDAKQAQKVKTEAATAARKAKHEERQRNVERHDERHDQRDDVRDVHQQNIREGKGSSSRISSSLRSEETRARVPRSEPSEPPSRRHAYPPDAFDRWYDAYPHKVGRGAAEKAFAKVRASDLVPLANLIEAVQRYRRTKPADREWCNPATWLNQKRWTDEPFGSGLSPPTDVGQPKIDFGGGVRWPESTVRSQVERWWADPSSWPEDRLGPPPTAPGCRVPDHLVRRVA